MTSMRGRIRSDAAGCPRPDARDELPTPRQHRHVGWVWPRACRWPDEDVTIAVAADRFDDVVRADAATGRPRAIRRQLAQVANVVHQRVIGIGVAYRRMLMREGVARATGPGIEVLKAD